MPQPPTKLENTIHDLLDEGETSVPAIAGIITNKHGRDIEGIDSFKDLIGTINRAKQEHD